MAKYTYERLSFQDNTFLQAETHDTHMHVASTLLFETGPLRTEDDGVDFDAIKQTIVDALHRIPRYRQRLSWIPIENQPVWVDDPHFDIDYHLRHTALPRPGTPEQLKKLSARIMSQQLDRKRPLWETWVVEGVDGGDSFALITKIHHCMIDGASGVDLAQVLLSPSSEPHVPAKRPPFVPRPEPTRAELLRDSIRERITAPARAVRSIQAFTDQFEDAREELRVRAKAVIDVATLGMHVDETPLNGEVGPHRQFDWLEMPLEDLKAVRKAWGCTINDVVLTIVTGAVREYLIHRAVDPSRIEFKISAPVSVRTDDERGKMGNRVSSWMVNAPIGESEPRKQLEIIHEETQRLRETRQALGVETIMTLASWAPATLMSLGAQASMPTNMVVTNVPGPQVPLFCSGARLKSIYPQVCLLANQGLGIAVMSYAGRVCWGFNSDTQVVPDAEVFVEKMAESIERVREAAAVTPTAKPAPKRSPRKKKTKSTPVQDSVAPTH